MTKSTTAFRYLAAALLGLTLLGAQGSEPTAPVARVSRLQPADLGLVINTNDPYSVEVGAYYIQRRGLAPEQVLRVALPQRSRLTPQEFDALQRQVHEHFGMRAQALALAWRQPYAVGCNAITGALALGFDEALCERSCGRSRPSPYFNVQRGKPLLHHGVRLSMLLAAPDVSAAKALIDRGVAADGRLGFKGAPPVNAYFVSTGDAARNVRARLFPPPALLPAGVQVRVEQATAPAEPQRVLLYLTGLAKVPGLDDIDWVPGALADHLTSFGGQLEQEGSQMNAMAWIASGATASHGAVSEPCNHLQKFPHPQLLLQHYLRGVTAIEAYWRSVAWPQQSLFVGEPLAAPFAR